MGHNTPLDTMYDVLEGPKKPLHHANTLLRFQIFFVLVIITFIHIFQLTDLDAPILGISQSHSTNEDDSVVFSCNAKGSGVIHYEFYKDGTKVDAIDNMKIINNIKRTDQGRYKCVVENEVMKEESNIIEMNVNCKKIFYFLKNLLEGMSRNRCTKVSCKKITLKNF